MKGEKDTYRLAGDLEPLFHELAENCWDEHGSFYPKLIARYLAKWCVDNGWELNQYIIPEEDVLDLGVLIPPAKRSEK